MNSTDAIGARNNPRTFLDRAPVTFAWDYNRDTLVNSTDEIIARNNGTTFLSALKLITVPGGGTFAIRGLDYAAVSRPLLPANPGKFVASLLWVIAETTP